MLCGGHLLGDSSNGWFMINSMQECDSLWLDGAIFSMSFFQFPLIALTFFFARC